MFLLFCVFLLRVRGRVSVFFWFRKLNLRQSIVDLKQEIILLYNVNIYLRVDWKTYQKRVAKEKSENKER